MAPVWLPFRFAKQPERDARQLRLVSVSIGFSPASVYSESAALARKSRLFRTSAGYEVHSASSGSKVATFQYKCSTHSKLWELQLEVATFQYTWLDSACRLGIGCLSVWVSDWALQIYDSAMLVCDNNLDLMCVCVHGFWGYRVFPKAWRRVLPLGSLELFS